MSNDLDQTRRWLINAGGAAVLANALPRAASHAQAATAAASPVVARDLAGNPTLDKTHVSPITTTLAEYVAGTLDRELPATVVARTKLHVLDTVAAMVSGSRLEPGVFVARYVESLGGKPQATVIGSRIVTSAVNAAFANGMAAHADETDDSNPTGPHHPGCGSVSAALATAEMLGRTGNDVLRAVTLGYDVGARVIRSFGGIRRHSPSPVTTNFCATAAAAAMLRLDPRQIRHAFSYVGQQASGIGYWDRDLEHVEKAFDFGGMGSRNGVTAATMVAMGFSAVEDPFSGSQTVFTALADNPSPEALVAGLGTSFEVFNTTIKKWSVGVPLQSVLDSLESMLEDQAVRAGSIKRIVIDVSPVDLHIIDNNPSPNLCLQHVAAMMLADGGTNFRNLHDAARMLDPKVLAIRKLVEVVPNEELRTALPARQTIVRIETTDGRELSRRTSATQIRGTARNPMAAQEVEAKALDLMAPVLGTTRASELIAAIGSLDQLGPVSRLRRLLQA